MRGLLNSGSFFIVIVVLLGKCYVNSQTCGGSFTQITSFTSPGYPSGYAHNLDCNWDIYAQGNYVIKVVFTSFNLETNFDYVTIFESVKYAWSQISRYTGTYAYAVTSRTNRLRIKFTTDGSVSTTGFAATVSFISVTQSRLNVPSSSRLNFKSPFYPNPYPTYVWETNWLGGHVGSKTLTLEITRCDIAPTDSLEIRDGSTQNSPLIGRYNNGNRPSGFIITTTPDAWILFKSSAYSARNTGYQIYATAGCKVSLLTTSGHIKSPGFSFASYPSSVSCTWNIKQAGTRQLTFYIEEMMTELGRDIVSASTNSITFGSRSGNIFNSTFFTTSDKDIKIQFNTNGQVSNKGFHITFSFDCPSIGNFTGGSFNGTNHYKSSLSFECQDGYYLKGERNITCQFGGVWSPNPPSCKVWTRPEINFFPQGSAVAIENIDVIALCRSKVTSFSRLVLLDQNGNEYRLTGTLFRFTKIKHNQTGVYRCKETWHGAVRYSDWMPLVVHWLHNNVTLELISPSSLLTGSSLRIHCNATGGPTLNYRWYKDGMVLSGFSDLPYLNITVNNVTDSGLYFCAVNNSVLASNSSAVNISVWEITTPLVSSNMEGLVKTGSHIIMNCNLRNFGYFTGAIFQWLKNGFVVYNGTRLILNNVTTSKDDGLYTCRVSKEDIQAVSRDVNITVAWMLIPSLETVNSRTSFPVGSDINLKCIQRSRTPSDDYIWYKNGIVVTPTNNVSHLFISSAAVQKTGNYTCRTVNSFDSKISNPLPIVVWDLLRPNISGSVTTKYKILGSNLTLNCIINGHNIGDLSSHVTWTGPTNQILLTSSSSLELVNLKRNQSGNYWCRVTKDNVSRTSDTFHVLVAWLDTPSLITSPQYTDLPKDSSIVMTCHVGNAYPPITSYAWYHNGRLLPQQTWHQIFIQSVSLNDVGNYFCTVASDLTTLSSSVISLSVWEMESPVITASKTGYIEVGENIVLNCSTNTQNTVLTWVDGANNIVSQTPLFVITDVRKSNTGRYRCKAIKRHLTTYSRFVFLDVIYTDQPTVSILQSNQIQEGSNVTLKCLFESNPLINTASWFLHGQLVMDGAKEFQIASVDHKDGGMYQCNVVDFKGNRYSSGEVLLDVQYLTNISISALPSSTIEEDNALVLNCQVQSSGDITYKWYRNHRELPETSPVLVINSIQRFNAGQYYCSASNQFKNEISQTVNVTVLYIDQPKITKTTQNRSATLNCSTNGIPEPVYQWSHYGELISNKSILVIDSINDTYIGEYVCTAKNTVGEYSTTTTTNKHYLNKPSIQILPQETVMESESVVMSCIARGSPPINYVWFKDGHPLNVSSSTLSSTSMYIIQNVMRDDTGNYHCQASNKQATKGSHNVYLIVHYVDVPSLSVSNNNPFINDPVTLLCKSQSYPVANYEWFQEDRWISKGDFLFIPSVNLQNAGKYTCRASIGSLQKSSRTLINVYYLNSISIEVLPKRRVIEGASVSMMCNSNTNVPSLNCTWTHNFIALSEDSCTMSLSSINRVNVGNYRCRVEANINNAANHTMDSSDIQVTVDYIDNIHIESSKHDLLNVTEGENILLKCIANMSGSGLVSWLYQNEVINNQAELMLRNVKTNDSGSYMCRIDVGDLFKIVAIDVDVYYFDNIEMTILPSNSIYEGVSFSITCQVKTNHIVSYNWFRNDQLIINQSGSRLLFQSANRIDSGSYRCIVENSFGFSKSSNEEILHIEYLGTPNITISKQPVFAKDDITLLCSSDSSLNATTKWYRKGQLISTSSLMRFDNISPNATGEHMCVINVGEHESRSFVSLVVNYLNDLSISTYPRDDVYEQNPLTITCKSASNLPITYELIHTQSNTTRTDSTGIFEIDSLNRTDSGLYICKGSNQMLSTESRINVGVKWLDSPTLTYSKSIDKISRGEDVTATCNFRASHISSAVIRWLHGELQISNSSVLYKKNIKLMDSGIYTCEITLGKLQKKTFFNLNVNYIDQPILETFPSISNGQKSDMVPRGSSLKLSCKCNASNIVKYQWFKDNQEVHNRLPTFIVDSVEVSSNGIYKCTVDNGLESKTSNEIEIQVSYLEIPSIITSTDPLKLNKGQRFSMNCTTTGSPQPSYTWLRNNEIIHNGTLVVIDEVNHRDSGTYICKASSDVGEKSAAIDLVVSYLDDPVQTIYPSENITLGSAVFFSCETHSNLKVNYTWLKDGLEIAGGNNYVISVVTKSSAGQYACRVANGRETITASPVRLNVLYHDELIIEVLPIKKFYREGDQVDIICKASGNPPPRVQWYKDGEPLGTGYYMPKNLSRDDSGMYECRSSNSIANKTTKSDFIVYYHDNKASIELSKESAVLGQNVTMKCNLYSNLPGIQYTWYKNEHRMDHENSSSLILSLLTDEDSGKYQCHVTTLFGNTSSDVYSLIVRDLEIPFIITSTDPLKLNNGQRFSMNCTANGSPQPSYTWLRNNKIIHNGTLVVINEVNHRDGGTYICKASSDVGEKSATIDLVVSYLDDPVQTIYPSENITLGSAVFFSCETHSNLKVNYTWLKDGLEITVGNNYVISGVKKSSAGRYACRVTNGRETKTASPVRLNVLYHDELIIEVLPIKKFYREGDQVDIICKASGNPPPRVQWYKDGEPLGKGYYMPKNLSRDDSGVYECRSSNSVANKTTKSDFIVYYHDNKASIELSKESTLLGQNISMKCNPHSNLPGIQYTWYKNGHRMDHENSSSLILSLLTDEDSGKYQCYVTTLFGNTSSDVYSLIVQDNCSPETNRCHENADCINNGASFVCTCKEGFHGNGVTSCDKDIETGQSTSDGEKEKKIYKFSTLSLAGAFCLLLFGITCYVIVGRCKRKSRPNRDSLYVLSSMENPLYDSIITTEDPAATGDSFRNLKNQDYERKTSFHNEAFQKQESNQF